MFLERKIKLCHVSIKNVHFQIRVILTLIQGYAVKNLRVDHHVRIIFLVAELIGLARLYRMENSLVNRKYFFRG